MDITEHITIDHTTMPLDDTEGAYERDLRLIDLLYNDDWEELDNEEITICNACAFY